MAKVHKIRIRGGASVPCPVCGAPSKVKFTRRTGLAVDRLRVCTGSEPHRFHTEEMRRSSGDRRRKRRDPTEQRQ